MKKTKERKIKLKPVQKKTAATGGRMVMGRSTKREM